MPLAEWDHPVEALAPGRSNEAFAVGVGVTAHTNGRAERVIGSIRRECFDHVIALNESGLRRVLHQYVDYPPGSYYAAAIDTHEQGREWDPEFQRSVRQTGRSFTLREGENVSVPLRLTTIQ